MGPYPFVIAMVTLVLLTALLIVGYRSHRFGFFSRRPSGYTGALTRGEEIKSRKKDISPRRKYTLL
jgi:hypothetical protein